MLTVVTLDSGPGRRPGAYSPPGGGHLNRQLVTNDPAAGVAITRIVTGSRVIREASMSTVRAPGALTRLARRHGLARSPLRRTTDRIEAAATAVVTILALLVVPLAVVIAMGSYHHELSEARTREAQPTTVTAVLLTDPQPQRATSFERGLSAGITARARWVLPNGQQRSAPLQVDADRHAGDRVPIWIDRYGNRTDPPPNLGCMIVNGAVIGFDLMLGGWMLLGALWWAVCRVLGRINAAWWEVQWARTEPRWSHRPGQ